jgi:hypothetical protein
LNRVVSSNRLTEIVRQELDVRCAGGSGLDEVLEIALNKGIGHCVDIPCQ